MAAKLSKKQYPLDIDVSGAAEKDNDVGTREGMLLVGGKRFKTELYDATSGKIEELCYLCMRSAKRGGRTAFGSVLV